MDDGYSWYNSRPAELFAIYNAWADKYDPKHKVAISLAADECSRAVGMMLRWRSGAWKKKGLIEVR